jgi:hypothetical protein
MAEGSRSLEIEPDRHRKIDMRTRHLRRRRGEWLRAVQERRSSLLAGVESWRITGPSLDIRNPPLTMPEQHAAFVIFDDLIRRAMLDNQPLAASTMR